MNDPGLNSLLKWGIRNSENPDDGKANGDSSNQNDTDAAQDPSRGIDREALSRLLGGPSDADRMKEAMAVIQSPEVDIENKKIAFDNFEQLIENLDNANNMESLGLWMPLVDLLTIHHNGGESERSDADELNFWAAWCIATAVQNNIKAQERLLVLSGVRRLLELAIHGSSKNTRKKAARALSSEIRNYQPALDELIKQLPTAAQPSKPVDAGDMEGVDNLIDGIREAAERGDWVK